MLDDRECLVAFGAFVREGREKQHIYQSHVASMLDVTQQSYSLIENGKRSLDFVMALKICEVLHLDMSDFIGTFVNKRTP